MAVSWYDRRGLKHLDYDEKANAYRPDKGWNVRTRVSFDGGNTWTASKLVNTLPSTKELSTWHTAGLVADAKVTSMPAGSTTEQEARNFGQPRSVRRNSRASIGTVDRFDDERASHPPWDNDQSFVTITGCDVEPVFSHHESFSEKTGFPPARNDGFGFARGMPNVGRGSIHEEEKSKPRKTRKARKVVRNETTIVGRCHFPSSSRRRGSIWTKSRARSKRQFLSVLICVHLWLIQFQGTDHESKSNKTGFPPSRE